MFVKPVLSKSKHRIKENSINDGHRPMASTSSVRWNGGTSRRTSKPKLHETNNQCSTVRLCTRKKNQKHPIEAPYRWRALVLSIAAGPCKIRTPWSSHHLTSGCEQKSSQTCGWDVFTRRMRTCHQQMETYVWSNHCLRSNYQSLGKFKRLHRVCIWIF